MLVNIKKFGRLGNRLFLTAHMVAFGIKHRIPIVNLGFSEYCVFFPSFRDRRAFVYSSNSSEFIRMGVFRRIFLRFCGLLPGVKKFSYWKEADYNFDSVDAFPFLNDLKQGSTVFLDAWLFRGYESLQKFRGEILRIFQPDQKLLDNISLFIDELRKENTVLIAVHVRWEDYRNTPFFLSVNDFVNRMKQCVDFFGNRTVQFVLFSNEKLHMNDWQGMNVAISHDGRQIFDLFCMTRCDYIMGPPSTFSGWASFYGNVPLAVLKAGDQKISLDDFSVVKG